MILIGSIFIKMIMKNIKIKMNRNEKGQTLLFVIVAVTIAMAVGVAVSTRTIQSLKRVARTDTSARVIAAAEGGIENLLSRSYSQLDEVAKEPDEEIDCSSIGAVAGPEDGTCSYVFTGAGSEQSGQTCTCTCNYCVGEGDVCSAVMGVSDSNLNSSEEDKPEVKASFDFTPEPVGDDIIGGCGDFQIGCSMEVSCDTEGTALCTAQGGTVTKNCESNPIDSGSGDLISSRAVVRVEKIEFEEGEEFLFNLVPGSLKEVNLDGYTADKIKICWESDQSAIYYLSYDSSGIVRKGGIQPSDFTHASYLNEARFVIGDETQSGYDGFSCKTVDLVSDPYGLRIKVLYNDSDVAVFPKSGFTLPSQGYKFTSVGEIVTGSGSEEKATVIVQKSYPYAPDIFDYGIYTPATLQ